MFANSPWPSSVIRAVVVGWSALVTPQAPINGPSKVQLLWDISCSLVELKRARSPGSRRTCITMLMHRHRRSAALDRSWGGSSRLADRLSGLQSRIGCNKDTVTLAPFDMTFVVAEGLDAVQSMRSPV